MEYAPITIIIDPYICPTYVKHAIHPNEHCDSPVQRQHRVNGSINKKTSRLFPLTSLEPTAGGVCVIVVEQDGV